MIKSAHPYAVHELFSPDKNILYRIPPYQREYSWQRKHWEDLFEDLVEAEGHHFLGTIIALDQTTDTAQKNILHVIDGQQRLTTLTLLLSAVHSVLKENFSELDDYTRTKVTNLSWELVRPSENQPRLVPQEQGNNYADYLTVLKLAGFGVRGPRQPYFGVRRIAKCYEYFREAILKFAESEQISNAQAALKVHYAARNAVIVKIEVASHSDAFVLFESLNNRGMPLSPVDLIKNQLLSVSESRKILDINEAFQRWNDMLVNLGDNYATQERFLRHYYNAFKTELPSVPNASVATRSNLIRIYEALLDKDVERTIDSLINASAIYGRINCIEEPDQATALDRAFKQLLRAQGATSYLLLLWLMTRRSELELSEEQLVRVTNNLTNFFVRRNLTGVPATHALSKLFMATIEALRDARGEAVLEIVKARLTAVSATDEQFYAHLCGQIYEVSTDVTRFVLATLAEDAMTKETWRDLWQQEKNRYVWTIEHILPQGDNLPTEWQDMLGGREEAARAQDEHRHKLGNLTVTQFNSNLGNKSFQEKRDRKDSEGRFIGYKNGLSLNEGLAQRSIWTSADIQKRTETLAERILKRFPLE